MMLYKIAKRVTLGALAAGLAACGGGGGEIGPAPPSAMYDLQAANAALVKAGLTVNVNLSGTAIVNGTSYSFTGTGTLTLSPGSTGTFNGAKALLQTEDISGTVSVAGQSSAYNSNVVNAYDSNGTNILGESQTQEFDVAPAPITIPSSVGSTSTALGTLNRYSDDTLSVAIGTTDISVAVTLGPADSGGPEVVQVTYKTYDLNKTLIETDTISYNLSESGALTFNAATAQNASGSISVAPQ